MPPSSWFLLVFVWWLLLALAAAAEQQEQGGEGCSAPKRCGKLNISRPFWLTDWETRRSCGRPDFEANWKPFPRKKRKPQAAAMSRAGTPPSDWPLRSASTPSPTWSSSSTAARKQQLRRRHIGTTGRVHRWRCRGVGTRLSAREGATVRPGTETTLYRAAPLPSCQCNHQARWMRATTRSSSAMASSSHGSCLQVSCSLLDKISLFAGNC